MILINIKMQIRPEKMDEWLALADSYAKDVNSEDGCLFFQFARSLTDDNEFVCIEGFKDGDAGAAHVSQPYVKRFFELAPALVATWIARSATVWPRNSHTSPVRARSTAWSRLILAAGMA